MRFILLFFIFIFSCSTFNDEKTKKIYICGDHPCSNKKEVKNYFDNNISIEVYTVTSKKKRDKEHGKICKTVKGKVPPKEIKFSEPENNEKFMVIIKNKKNPKYMIKIKGPTKEEASKKGMKNCKQKNPNLASDCYVHYSTIVSQF